MLGAVTARAVTAEARAGEDLWLGYNYSTGAAATGRIDANGNYSDLRFFNLGTEARIVPTTTGGVVIFRGGVVLRAQIDAQGGLTGGLYVRGLSSPGAVVFVR